LQEIVDRLAKTEVDLTAARESEQTSSSQAASIKSTLLALEQRFHEMSRQYDAEIKARDEAQKAAELRQVKAVRAQKVGEVVKKVVEKLEVEINRASEKKEELLLSQTSQSTLLTNLRLEIKTLRTALDQLNQEVHQSQLQQVSGQSKIDAMTEKIDEELGVDPEILVKEFDPKEPISLPNPEDPENPVIIQYDRESQEKRLKKAEKELVALGKVNPLALEEFEALEERHKYLTSQLQDLEKSRKDLLVMIDEIEQKTILSFTAAFGDTAKEFEENVFPALFPGGVGKMELTDPDNPLTTGIEIHAQPAGKRISRLSLLSGGERSLVAVAMLVAIFKSRPSPFYVMDEVEAALDDVNLSRLLSIFKDLRKTSQLLIVTHQKRTMEVADALYGITMRKDGITQVISQKTGSNVSSEKSD
jgi:chromosome segregation protein